MFFFLIILFFSFLNDDLLNSLYLFLKNITPVSYNFWVFSGPVQFSKYHLKLPISHANQGTTRPLSGALGALIPTATRAADMTMWNVRCVFFLWMLYIDILKDWMGIDQRGRGGSQKWPNMFDLEVPVFLCLEGTFWV